MAVEVLSEHLVLFDAEDRVVFANKAWRELNKEVAEFTKPGTRFEDHLRALTDNGLVPEAIGREEAWCRERLERHLNPSGPFEVTRQDGRWIRVHEQRLPNDGIILIISDITESKRVEQGLRESEELLHDAIENISEGFLMYDADDRFVLCNTKFRELYAVASKDFVLGRKFEEILRAGVERGQYPEAKGRVEEWIAERMQQHREPGQQIERQLPDGRWVKIVETRTNNGSTVGIRADITELKARENLLRESEQRYKSLVDLSPDGVMVHCDNEIVFCNDAFAEMLGADSPQQIIGRSDLDFIPTNEHAIVKDRRERMLRGEHVGLRETTHQRFDGALLNVVRTATPITWQGKEAFLVLTRDITAQKEAEAHLQLNQKMESLGTLAGGIAHDLNNTLVPILGLTEMVLEDLPEASPERAQLETVVTAAERGKELVGMILAFSRQDEPDRKPTDLGNVIKEALSLLRSTIPATIEIREDLEDDMPSVTVDPTQIHQVLMNLGSNAGYAMGVKPGVLEVVLKPLHIDETLAAGHPELPPGPYAKLIVRDTGPGIDKETLERVFDPFFTTKDVGEGTGLGLSVVHGIVTAHGGAITVSSEPGHGTTFEIYLPFERRATSCRQLSTRRMRDAG